VRGSVHYTRTRQLLLEWLKKAFATWITDPFNKKQSLSSCSQAGSKGPPLIENVSLKSNRNLDCFFMRFFLV
ncbi:MAG: hypothetical protein WC375_10575, partial [Methanomassiliicoccales archaeon]